MGVRTSEHRIRWALVVAMFIWLFLPFNRPPDVQSNGEGIVIVFIASALMLTDRPSSGDIVYLFLSLLTSFGIPLLLMLNLALTSSRSKTIRTLYRLLLLYLLPAKGYSVLHIDERFRSVGYWAGAILVSIAVLLEIIFFIRGRQSKAQLTH